MANKGPCSQGYVVFPVVMDSCESWIIKKAECLRIDALWCWRRLLRVPRTARRLNQSILKEINPEYSMEGLMLKLQYCGQLMWTAKSLEKSLMLVKIEGKRSRGCQRMRQLDGITDATDMNLGKLWEMERDPGIPWQEDLACCSPWGRKESDVTEWLNKNNKSNNQNYQQPL